MFPHSFLKGKVDARRTSFGELQRVENEDNLNEDLDCFNYDTGIILEDEEEYDILNNETFGERLTDFSNEHENDLVPAENVEDYDLHNDETFGEEHIDYDWEAEHEKLVNILETSGPDTDKEHDIQISYQRKNLMQNADQINRNGYRVIENTPGNNYLLDDRSFPKKIISNDVCERRVTKDPFDGLPSLSKVCNRDDYESNEKYYNDGNEFGSSEKLTSNNCNGLLKRDKWFDLKNSSKSNASEEQTEAFFQGYSLFSSGTNLLQNAGIYIPSTTNRNSPSGKLVDNSNEKFESMKLQSIPNIPSVSDLEKQWMNDAALKPVITADCFRAYNSAVFVNNAFACNVNPSQGAPPAKDDVESLRLIDGFRNIDQNTLIQTEKMVFPAVPGNQMFASAAAVKNEKESQPIFCSNLNVGNSSPFLRKSYGTPIFSETGLLMYNNVCYRNTSNFADTSNLGASPAVSINSFMNNSNMQLSQNKVHSMADPALLIASDSSSRLMDGGSLLIDNANNISGLLRNNGDSRVSVNIFPPPPGLTIDPSKMVRVPNTASAIQSHQHLSSSYLTLPPLQALSGIITMEQQKKLMKMQKECSVSNIDEYAGMMTEREKYWLSGVQLLQINSMDPHKDDYYFTNYQARRKGNRNKNQNQNNSSWKNQHTKDYSPLQFENSLGRVQLGSVVAPRKVIDTCLFESSPKHNCKSSDIVRDDPIVATSSRKRKAIMLHIENMYGKIMALENLQVNSGKNKNDLDTIKSEFENIVTGLQEEILNLKDDFKIIMSIKKGKRLVLRFLSFCDNPDTVWYQIFEIIDRIIRGDQEHCVLLSYLPYFRAWLSSTKLNTLIRISSYFKGNLGFFLQDKFSVSVIANMIEQAEIIYPYSNVEEQDLWMNFILSLAEKTHSCDNVQKPVVSVKAQILRSHLLKCKKLQNGYMSQLLKIFSNNTRK